MLKLALALALLVIAAPAHADDCVGRSLTEVHAGPHNWVDRARVERDWPGEHAHLVVFAPRSKSLYLVIDSGADHHTKDRLRVYAADGRLVRTWGLEDLMSASEIARLQQSISHLEWVSAYPDALAKVFERDGDTVRLALASGKVARISLAGASPTLRVD